MLERLYVDNYKTLINFECSLKRVGLILGPNGAGKSSIFEVLSLLREFCVGGVAAEGRLVGSSLTRWQRSTEQTFELDVSGNGGHYKFRLVVDSWGDLKRPRVLKEEVEFSGKPIFRFAQGEVHLFNDRHEDKVRYPFDWSRSALATISERKDNTKLSWFKRWLGGILCVSIDPWQMRGIAEQEVTKPDDHLNNFADWFRHLRQETDDQEYIKDLADAIEGFVTMRLEGAGENRREIKIRMAGLNGSDSQQYIEYTLGELSEGQRVLIGLYATLHFGIRPNTTICFDEPDNFIALREVQPWLSKVLDRTDESIGSQVLIVSHHPELLNRLAFNEGIFLDRPNGRQTRVRAFKDPAETGLSAAELVLRGWERE